MMHYYVFNKVDESFLFHSQFLSEDRLHYRSARTKELDNMLGDLHCDIIGLALSISFFLAVLQFLQ